MMFVIGRLRKVRPRCGFVCITIFFVCILALVLVKNSQNDIKIYVENATKLDFKWTTNSYSSENVFTRTKPTPFFLFILILSKPTARVRRDTIRNTWLDMKVHHSITMTKFFLGTEKLSKELVENLVKEQEEFGDITLLGDLMDSYNALTRKVLLAMTWIGQNVECKFVLKVDDDCHVNIEELLFLLRTEYVNETRLTLGRFNHNSPILKSGKWRETEWAMCSTYLPYSLGMGYVLSFQLVQFIARNSDMLHMYANEDVSVATWLVPLHPKKADRKPLFQASAEKNLTCHSTKVVLTHMGWARDIDKKLLERHKRIQNLKVQCERSNVMSKVIYGSSFPKM